MFNLLILLRFPRSECSAVSSSSLKSILLGPDQAAQKGANLPADLNAQAKGSAHYAQYCPNQAMWLCRPNDLPGTDLTYAFEAG